MIPQKYDEMCSVMETLLNQTIYSRDIYDPSIAYTCSRTNDLCGTIYRIYVNNTDTELARFLYLHECGHILFGHVKNMELRMDRFLLSKLSIAYSKISRYFPKYEEYLEVFRTVVFNIVMDFEVNSRIFSEPEWDFMNERVGNLLGQNGMKGMWPEDYGYPSGLTWNEYLTLILLNPEKFMKQFKEQLDDMTRESEVGIEKEPTERDKLSDKALSKLHEYEGQHSKGKFDLKEIQTNGRSTYSRENNFGAAEKYTDMNELFKTIAKVLEHEVPRPNRNDILYNYNRKKYSTEILIPKRVNSDVIQPRKLFILLDVSDSINPSLVNGLIKVFKEYSDRYSNTVFAAWDTALVNEWKAGEEIKFQGGGGTKLAPGIAYLNSRYKLNSNDVLFVMSDFLDNLNDWKKELAKVRANKYAINWNSYYASSNPGFKKVFSYSTR